MMEAFFSGRKWNECLPRDLRPFGESLSFFTPRAFAYYLPAFMLAHIDDPKASDRIGQAVCIHLLSEDSTSLSGKLAALTSEQLQALCQFVKELGPNLVGGAESTRAMERLHAL